MGFRTRRSSAVRTTRRRTPALDDAGTRSGSRPRRSRGRSRPASHTLRRGSCAIGAALLRRGTWSRSGIGPTPRTRRRSFSAARSLSRSRFRGAGSRGSRRSAPRAPGIGLPSRRGAACALLSGLSGAHGPGATRTTSSRFHPRTLARTIHEPPAVSRLRNGFTTKGADAPGRQGVTTKSYPQDTSRRSTQPPGMQRRPAGKPFRRRDTSPPSTGAPRGHVLGASVSFGEFLPDDRRACTISTATSDGETPAIRPACPTVAGRQRPSFSRDSRESP